MAELVIKGNCAVIVAHPDDETLWAGGTILMNPWAKWNVITLCRGSDIDRNPKFFKAIWTLGADGLMGDMDDSAEQEPLDGEELREIIVRLLGGREYEMILTHSPSGEYTHHRRHEEVSIAVADLVEKEKIAAKQFLMFAYDDGQGQYYPRAQADADHIVELSNKIWQKKYEIMTKIYGFGADSWEAQTTPRVEAFRQGYR